MGTYFAYARVSTPRQGEKGVSLPDEQKVAIERYAKLNGFEITRWFEEQQSASRTGRPAFSLMLRLLRKGVACGVIIHKLDRGVRNLEDWVDVGRLVDAGVEVHFANENVDLRTVAGRLSADIQAVVAAHYSRNLREEVKKGIYGRLKQGYYPFRAPIGYLDQGSAKVKVLDPLRAPLLKEAFTLYRSERYSLPQLAETMFRRGLRNLAGGAVTINGFATLLQNPFYIGLIRIGKTGETFKGNHDPLIRTEVFEDVKSVLAGKRVDREVTHVFTYSRIVQCGTCGYSLIAETQKGHVYYRCHNRPFKNPPCCPATSIREEQLDDAVLSRLSDIELTDEEVSAADVLLSNARAETEAKRALAANGLRLQLDQIRGRIAKLTDLLIEGTIDKALFEERKTAILVEETKAKQTLTEIEQGTFRALERLEKTVELAKGPSMLYKRASPDEKRELLKTLLSNLLVIDKNVEIALHLPFQLIADRPKTLDGRPYRGTCRTWENTFFQLHKHFTDNIAA